MHQYDEKLQENQSIWSYPKFNLIFHKCELSENHANLIQVLLATNCAFEHIIMPYKFSCLQNQYIKEHEHKHNLYIKKSTEYM